MFIPLEELAPAVEAAGFTQVHVDDSDSLMAFELPEEAAAEADGAPPGRDARRNRVHGRHAAQFEHLKNFDMNALCARVVVVARKPS